MRLTRENTVFAYLFHHVFSVFSPKSSFHDFAADKVAMPLR
jgi:hypothetical protein